MSDTPKFFSNKEIAVALNNAWIAAKGSVSLKNTDEKRRKCLNAYLSAILDSILEHRKGNHMTAEELVWVFVGGALFIHYNLVTGGGANKLQAYSDLASELAADQEELAEKSKPKKKGRKK